MRRNNGIDLFRLIGAFFIMTLHTDYGNLDHVYVDMLRLLGRWVVPFFFITSGYFLSYKIDNKNLSFQKIQNNISTLITILIVSSTIYTIINLIKGDYFYHITPLLGGAYFHLWFIGSLLLGYIFIWYLYYIKKDKLLPIISIIIIILALLSNSYDLFFGINLEFDGFYRFLLSIPFMYFGMFIVKKNVYSISKMALISLLIFGILLQILEHNFLKKSFNYLQLDHQFLIGTIFMTIPLFILSATINIKENKLTIWGKEYSLFIYLYHPIVYTFLNLFNKKIFPNYFNFIQIFNPIIGFTLILLIAIISNRYFNKLYKLLIGIIDLRKN